MKAIKSEMSQIRGSQSRYCSALSLLGIWQGAPGHQGSAAANKVFFYFSALCSDSEIQHLQLEPRAGLI